MIEKRSIVGGYFGKLHRCILVCDRGMFPNQVLAPAAIISMERAENHLWWEKEKRIRETKKKRMTSYSG